MTVNDVKKKYNQLLKRFRAAERWLDDPERTEEEINKYYQDFLSIINGLNHCLNLLKKMNVHPVTKEILEGFKGDV